MFPDGGSVCAIVVATGTDGSSHGWTSAYWSSQKLSFLPQMTECAAVSRARSSE